MDGRDRGRWFSGDDAAQRHGPLTADLYTGGNRATSGAMSDIPPPSVPVANENRFLFCQMAIESRLQDLVDDAVKAGWDEDEVLVSIIELADNLMLATRADDDLERLVQAFRRS